MAHRLSVRLQRDEAAILPLAGSSRAMLELARQVDHLVRADVSTALLIGEAGTGKGRLAEYIHSSSSRSARAFVEINCATMDHAALASDLFGAPGAPPGSGALLDAVRGGTLLIADVSDLPCELQPQLLQMLEAQAALCEAAPSAGVRVIAAASKDLVSEVNAGRFREDLYYRLSATPLHLPPLRARSREDLSELIIAAFNVLSANISNSPRILGDGVVDSLIAYPWPGNIRELRNALERALLIGRGETVLQRAHLPPELHDPDGFDAVHTPRTLMDVERAHIHRTLRAHKLNRTHAARELGISRATLIKKIKEYGLVYRSPDPT